MADYDPRQYCSQCHNEVYYGRHAHWCSVPGKLVKLREQQELERQRRLDEKIWKRENSIAVYELMLSLRYKLNEDHWALLARYYDLENND